MLESKNGATYPVQEEAENGADVALLYRELATIESRIRKKAAIALRLAYRPI